MLSDAAAWDPPVSHGLHRSQCSTHTRSPQVSILCSGCASSPFERLPFLSGQLLSDLSELLRCLIRESLVLAIRIQLFQVEARVLLPAPLPRVIDREGRRGSCFHSYFKCINCSWIFEQYFH
ncbi:unnamed protein product [Cuscuta europaea]|uniref:Uncharacterized protein n=1 Tax=Cuscuta europaea TaxID=41803 RepID=A0A9P1EET5_CUSEU|nr:unnamed protein product [Cuscuta europaea]